MSMSERPLTVSSIVHNWSGHHPTSPSIQALDSQLPPAFTSEVSLRTQIQNTAFWQKNGIHSERKQNKFLYSLRMEVPWLSGPQRRAFCVDITHAADRYPVIEVRNIRVESMTLPYWYWVFPLVLLRTWFTLTKYCRDRTIFIYFFA
jgi:hypothetical protein